MLLCVVALFIPETEDDWRKSKSAKCRGARIAILYLFSEKQQKKVNFCEISLTKQQFHKPFIEIFVMFHPPSNNTQ